MRQSGLADLLPSLRGRLGGPECRQHGDDSRIGEDFVARSRPPATTTLGMVDFSIFPHLDHPALPENTMAARGKMGGRHGGPAYAIDDETAIKVVDGAVEVVSEGHSKLF